MTPEIYNALSKQEQESFIRKHDPTPQGTVNVLIRKEMKVAYIYSPGFQNITISNAEAITEDEYEKTRFGYDFAIHCLDGLPEMQIVVDSLNSQN